MKRLAIVSACDNCPNNYWYVGTTCCCILMNKKPCYIDDSVLKEDENIPSWCPLPAATNYHIVSWYDRHTRSYVTQLKDEDENQVGEAKYDGNKECRDLSISEFELIIKEKYASNICSLKRPAPIRKLVSRKQNKS